MSGTSNDTQDAEPQHQQDDDSNAGQIPASQSRDSQPQSRLSNLLILLSFAFSISVLIWAVWIACSAVTPSHPVPMSHLNQTSTKHSVSTDPKEFGSRANLTSEEYVQYARQLDEKVLRKAQVKSATAPPKSVSKEETRKAWKSRRDKLREHVQQLNSESGGGGFDDGTAENEYLQQLEKVYQDVPPSR